MASLVESDIIEKLKQYSSQGISYYQAKENLIKSGFSEADIKLASYSYNYGEKPPEQNPIKKAMEQHPELAEKIAAGIADEMKSTSDLSGLKELAKDDVVDNKINVPESHSPIIQIGLSWWLWLPVNVVLLIIMLVIKPSVYYFGIVPLIFVVILIIRLSINNHLKK